MSVSEMTDDVINKLFDFQNIVTTGFPNIPSLTF